MNHVLLVSSAHFTPFNKGLFVFILNDSLFLTLFSVFLFTGLEIRVANGSTLATSISFLNYGKYFQCMSLCTLDKLELKIYAFNTSGSILFAIQF